MSEKDELLETKERGLESGALKKVILVFAIVLSLITPQIYVASNIYYTSLDLEREKRKLSILQDENRKLRHRLEVTKFRYDTEYKID